MIEKLTSHFKDILKDMKYDLDDQQIKETPKRIAKMWVNELFKGNYEKAPELTVFEKHRKK